MPPLGLYAHVPHCRRRCPYCSFNTFAGQDELLPLWVDDACAELDLRLASWPSAPPELTSIYLGGGTPSLLDPGDVGRFLDHIRSRLPLRGDVEITLEVNPGTVDRRRLEGFRAVGVNRVTVGVQSFRDAALVRLGRLHDVAATEAVLRDLQAAGFPNWNLDLMFALPDQDLPAWSHDLDRALAWGPTHLSLYNLTLEEGTPFHAEHESGALRQPEEELQREMLILARERCRAHGLSPYELSNFARPGWESRHNRLYWENAHWIALGAGAHGVAPDPAPLPDGAPSFGRRWWNLRSPRRWRSAIGAGRLPEDGHERLSRHDAMTEQLMLRLRTAEGVDEQDWLLRFGLPLSAAIGQAGEDLLSGGTLERVDRWWRIAEHAVPITDSVVLALARALDTVPSSAIVARR